MMAQIVTMPGISSATPDCVEGSQAPPNLALTPFFVAGYLRSLSLANTPGS